MFRNINSVLRAAAFTGAGAMCLALVSCSSSGSAGSSTSSPTGLSGVTPVASSGVNATGATNATGAAGACGGSSAAAAKAALGSYGTEVTDVTVIGGCHQLSIDTTLAASDPLSPTSTKAVAICRTAAKVAYVDGVTGVTVSWTDGHEAAAGQQGMDCIPG